MVLATIAIIYYIIPYHYQFFKPISGKRKMLEQSKLTFTFAFTVGVRLRAKVIYELVVSAYQHYPKVRRALQRYCVVFPFGGFFTSPREIRE